MPGLNREGTVQIYCLCHTCSRKHIIDFDPRIGPGSGFSDWLQKHPSEHSTEFVFPQRRQQDGRHTPEHAWESYLGNADVKVAYAADAAFTITLASLATSSTWVAGREATSVSNTTNLYLDYEITGKITTGTSPTVDTEIRVYAIQPINDTPTWPDVFDGTDSAETVTNTQILARLPLLWAGTVSATSDISYPIVSAPTLAGLFGQVPFNFTLFVTHNTAVNLNSTGSNHELNYKGIYATVA